MTKSMHQASPKLVHGRITGLQFDDNPIKASRQLLLFWINNALAVL